MKYLITTKQEWADAALEMGCVFDTPEEAVNHAVQDWGTPIKELLVIPIDKVLEVDQQINYTDFKGEVK